MNKSSRLLALLPLVLPFVGMAQDGLQQELLLTKPYQPSVNEAVKLDQLPGMIDTATIRPSFNYSITSQRLDSPLSQSTARAAGLQPVQTPELNIGYLRLGLGTYRTPMGELALNTRRSEKFSGGLNLSHLSSDGKVELDNGHKVFSGFSDNRFSAYGKTFFRAFSLSADVGYRRLVSHAYGYDPHGFPAHLHLAKKDIRNIYQMGDLNVAVRSLNRSKVSYSGTLSLRNTTDDFDARERQLMLAGELQKGTMGLRYMADMLDRSDVMLQNGRAVTTAGNPYYLITTDKMRLELGAKAQLFKEEGDHMHYRLYPVAEIQYELIHDALIPFAGVNGGVRTRSYRSMIEENPHLMSGYNVPTFTDTRFQIYAGFKGSLGSLAQYYLRSSYSSVKGDRVFLNADTPASQNYFFALPVSYKQFTMGVDLYVQPSDNFDLTFKGTYYHYEVEPWDHMLDRPDFEASLVARYVYESRWSLQFDVTATGNRYYLDLIPDVPDFQSEVRIDGVLNFGLKAEYFLTNRLSVFTKLSNFTTSKYYRWMNYPIQRFQVMGGVTFAF